MYNDEARFAVTPTDNPRTMYTTTTCIIRTPRREKEPECRVGVRLLVVEVVACSSNASDAVAVAATVGEL